MVERYLDVIELKLKPRFSDAHKFESIMHIIKISVDDKSSIPTFHKTLEQNFMRLIVSCIRFMADDKNRHIDLRNKGAHETAKILNQALEDHKEDIYMPYI